MLTCLKANHNLNFQVKPPPRARSPATGSYRVALSHHNLKERSIGADTERRNSAFLSRLYGCKSNRTSELHAPTDSTQPELARPAPYPRRGPRGSSSPPLFLGLAPHLLYQRSSSSPLTDANSTPVSADLLDQRIFFRLSLGPRVHRCRVRSVEDPERPKGSVCHLVASTLALSQRIGRWQPPLLSHWTRLLTGYANKGGS